MTLTSNKPKAMETPEDHKVGTRTRKPPAKKGNPTKKETKMKSNFAKSNDDSELIAAFEASKIRVISYTLSKLNIPLKRVHIHCDNQVVVSKTKNMASNNNRLKGPKNRGKSSVKCVKFLIITKKKNNYRIFFLNLLRENTHTPLLFTPSFLLHLFTINTLFRTDFNQGFIANAHKDKSNSKPLC